MEFSPFDSQHWDDPYPIYAELRAQERLHFSPEADAFCVTRYGEAAEVFKRPIEHRPPVKFQCWPRQLFALEFSESEHDFQERFSVLGRHADFSVRRMKSSPSH